MTSNEEMINNWFKEIEDEKAKRLAKESRKRSSRRTVSNPKGRAIHAPLEEVKK